MWANEWRLSAASPAFDVGTASWRRINLVGLDRRDDGSYGDCKAVAAEVNRMAWRALLGAGLPMCCEGVRASLGPSRHAQQPDRRRRFPRRGRAEARTVSPSGRCATAWPTVILTGAPAHGPGRAGGRPGQPDEPARGRDGGTAAARSARRAARRPPPTRWRLAVGVARRARRGLAADSATVRGGVANYGSAW